MDKYITKTFRFQFPNGEVKRVYVRGKTEKEAITKLNQQMKKYNSQFISIDEKTTFGQFSQKYIEIYRKPRVTNKTYKDMVGTLQRVFYPFIGNMSMTKIKKVHIQECINQLENRSESYIKKCVGLVKSIFEAAIDEEIIHKNPANNLTKPKVKIEEPRRALSAEERQLFIEVAREHPKGTIFLLSLACGLRPNEARALTRFNIDLDKKIIKITQAIESGSKTIKSPKTNAGIRNVFIPDWFLGDLRAVCLNNNTPYLFHNQYGKPLSETGYLRAWHSLKRTMDIKAGAKLYRNQIIIHAIDQNISPYYLRHTYATELAENNVDLKTAQYLMGHSDIGVTAKIYTHVTNTMLESAREKTNMAMTKSVTMCNRIATTKTEI